MFFGVRQHHGLRAARGPRSLRALVAIAVCMLALVGPIVPNAAADDRESLVKAAYLYHFVDFVDWPDSLESDPGEVIRVGILGEDPFGALVDDVFAEPSSDGRHFEVVRSVDARDLTSCRLVYVALGDGAAVDEALEVLAGKPLLVVGHEPGFAARGGHVNFFVEDERLRFEVNLETVRAAGLRLNSRMLKLARIVDLTDAR